MSEPYKIEDLLKAKPIDAPNKANVRWGRRRKQFKIKWNVHSQKGSTLPQKKKHPGTEVAKDILGEVGRSLITCEECESRNRTCIHHIDSNPYNNELSNLQVLCWSCHQKKHDPSGIIYEDLEVPLDDE